MKIRNGFVSNSSSSSFVLIMKNGKEVSKETLLEAFDVKETSPLYSFADELATWIIDNVEEYNIAGIYDNYYGDSDDKTEEEMIEEMTDEDGDYAGIDKDLLEKIASKEYKYYNCYASDEGGDGLEYFLCQTGICMDTDTIKIESGGSY